ncbi:MAG: hypothetical protein ACLQVI_28965 [Polyangiaceae bacterium]
MSPAEIAVAVRLRLAGELNDDIVALDKLASTAAALQVPARDARDDWMRALALAFEVERYYTAVEATLTRLLRALDGDVPTGPSSHQEILRASSVAIDGGRPVLLGPDVFAELRELLKFRHLARHGYESEPDLVRMVDHASRVGRAHASFVAGLRRVEGWLRSGTAG